ncbi:hypothetical protein HYDPIDRAFT_115483 [Hydnomerulius pinastri MD-312]|uniref:Uncharacterized protein n=1 Tax=Hydnomerulius pinastri MD-312 TaxID=994086 RepID=A0A0C9VUK6_9AGAM|nr:hypothetical protein HYDPIDRAFT_115483 [Hydnomerulius pinastri MD-312]
MAVISLFVPLHFSHEVSLVIEKRGCQKYLSKRRHEAEVQERRPSSRDEDVFHPQRDKMKQSNLA